jgi:hypothetical protein
MNYTLSFTKESTNELVSYDQNQLHQLYLDYFNNFLTILKFSEQHGLTKYEATKVIELGRLIDKDLSIIIK